MIIYLDRNIHEDIRQNRKHFSKALATKCYHLKKQGYLFPCSCIHAEETATSFVLQDRPGADKYIREEIEFILSISEGRIIVPIDRKIISDSKNYTGIIQDYVNFFVIVVENLNDRVQLVVDYVDQTRDALNNDLERDFCLKSHQFCSTHLLKSNMFNSINPCSFFEDAHITLLYGHYCESYELGPLISDFDTFMAAIEHRYDFLDVIQYYKTKDIHKETSVRSRMYDVGHVIYASSCDVLVTDDQRMLYKAKAIYADLGIRTEVMSPLEFCKQL